MSLIQVLGAGCSRCNHLMKNAEEAANRLGRDDRVEKVEDFNKIFELAPLALPALAIDGKIVFAGGLPSVNQICEALNSRSRNGTRHSENAESPHPQ